MQTTDDMSEREKAMRTQYVALHEERDQLRAELAEARGETPKEKPGSQPPPPPAPKRPKLSEMRTSEKVAFIHEHGLEAFKELVREAER